MSTNVRTIRQSGSDVRQITGQILIYITGIGLFAAAITKFAQLPPVVAQLTNAGFGGEKITLVASLELVSLCSFFSRLPGQLGFCLLLPSWVGPLLPMCRPASMLVRWRRRYSYRFAGPALGCVIPKPSGV